MGKPKTGKLPGGVLDPVEWTVRSCALPAEIIRLVLPLLDPQDGRHGGLHWASRGM